MAFKNPLGLFKKKTTSAETQIEAPNANGLRDDADAKLPRTNGLIRSHDEQVKLAEELLGSGLKALPVKSKIEAPNNNGLRDDANAPIPVKDGLVRTPEQQMALMAKLVGKDAKTPPPVPSVKLAEDRLMIDRRATIYKPMPQNSDVIEQEAKSPEDVLKSEFEGLLADLKQDAEARNRENEARSKPGDEVSNAPKKDGRAIAPTVKPNANGRPVPPPKPDKFRAAPVTTFNGPKPPAVTSPLVAENGLSAQGAKPTHVVGAQQHDRTAQNHFKGKK